MKVEDDNLIYVSMYDYKKLFEMGLLVQSGEIRRYGFNMEFYMYKKIEKKKY
jgi:hypothetical protein